MADKPHCASHLNRPLGPTHFSVLADILPFRHQHLIHSLVQGPATHADTVNVQFVFQRERR